MPSVADPVHDLLQEHMQLKDLANQLLLERRSLKGQIKLEQEKKRSLFAAHTAAERRLVASEEGGEKLRDALNAAEGIVCELRNELALKEQALRNHRLERAILEERVGERVEIEKERDALIQELSRERQRAAQFEGELNEELEGIRQELGQKRAEWSKEKATLGEEATLIREEFISEQALRIQYWRDLSDRTLDLSTVQAQANELEGRLSAASQELTNREYELLNTRGHLDVARAKALEREAEFRSLEQEFATLQVIFRSNFAVTGRHYNQLLSANTSAADMRSLLGRATERTNYLESAARDIASRLRRAERQLAETQDELARESIHSRSSIERVRMLGALVAQLQNQRRNHAGSGYAPMDTAQVDSASVDGALYAAKAIPQQTDRRGSQSYFVAQVRKLILWIREGVGRHTSDQDRSKT